jgi:hypothetical protein
MTATMLIATSLSGYGVMSALAEGIFLLRGEVEQLVRSPEFAWLAVAVVVGLAFKKLIG